MGQDPVTTLATLVGLVVVVPMAQERSDRRQNKRGEMRLWATLCAVPLTDLSHQGIGREVF